jgi:hypothetical protein
MTEQHQCVTPLLPFYIYDRDIEVGTWRVGTKVAQKDRVKTTSVTEKLRWVDGGKGLSSMT